jgi:hypothetical protein
LPLLEREVSRRRRRLLARSARQNRQVVGSQAG